MSMGLEALLANRTEIDAELRKNKSPVTVMFTDLAGSTAFFDKFGDTAGVKWIEEHNTIVFPHIKAQNGTIVKTIGDSVMAHFASPADAVKAGAEILRALSAENQKKDPKDRMYVRVALHHGLGYLRGGDVFGDVVNVAARIAKKCLPGQILVSEAVYLNAHETAGLAMQPVAAVQFRGKASVEQLYEALWTDEATYAELRALFPASKTADASSEDFTGGRYVIQTELGRGAMGVVYKAYDRVIGRQVALKTIPLEVEESERAGLVQRLKKEAQTAGALDHPNLVTVFDAGDEAGVFYFTMQYVEGRPLSDLRRNKELLALEKIYDICEQMLSGMQAAHSAGVIHRDLKPSNMMLTPKCSLKIMDFGIAKFGDSALTKAGMVLGTPSYLAPEQAAGRRIDHRADIFSLGAITYELFTGERAFPGESTTSIIYKVMNDEPIPPRAIEPSLSPALDSVIRKALAKDPINRFKSCEEFATALRNARSNADAVIEVAPATVQRTVAIGGGTAVRTAMAPAVTQAVPVQDPSSNTWKYVAAAAMVVAVSIGGYFAFARKNDAPQAAVTIPSTVNTPASQTQSAPVAAETVANEPQPQPRQANSATSTPQEIPDGALAKAERRQKARERVKEKLEEAAPVSGSGMWTREDIPDLLKKADGYAGKGEYGRAITTYREVLRIEPSNAAAREGIQRAREAAQIRR
jgi:eukaryotic-like serine/threonine-protein kinase